jgi:hypothetical protein
MRRTYRPKRAFPDQRRSGLRGGINSDNFD